MRGGGESEGALGPTVAVLVVSLTIAAVGVYELCGFGLHILNPRPRLFNNGFATAGVIVAVVAAGAAVGNLVWLLTAPLRRDDQAPAFAAPLQDGVDAPSADTASACTVAADSASGGTAADGAASAGGEPGGGNRP
ncbi:hypothetical protein [Streptomyces sp. NPDC018610]|uniref:hypothetical protein n=1 Tax=Streptomyces sp. NPDC018610 TaxID=3365049 RepID=UPI0037A9379B